MAAVAVEVDSLVVKLVEPVEPAVVVQEAPEAHKTLLLELQTEAAVAVVVGLLET
jgi:hypothetical protein